MKMIRLGGFLLVATGLLSACGLVAKAIPPIELQNKNALGLSGQEILVDLGLVATIKQDVSKSGQIAADFTDGEKPDMKGFTPGSIEAVLKLVSVDVSGMACKAPDTFKLAISATGKVFEKTNPQIVANATASSEVMVAKKDGTYTLASAAEIKLGFSSNLINIVTSGGDNRAEVDYTVSSTENQLAGCTIKFVVGDQIVTLRDWQG